MWRSWHGSGGTAPDGTGSALVMLAVGIVAGAGAGNLVPPAPAFALLLLPMVAVAAWRGLRPHPRVTLWWVAAGVMAGLAACAVAPQIARRNGRTAVPVRVRFTVRDAWRRTAQGAWMSRVVAEEVEQGGRRIRMPRELGLSVGGSADPGVLPAPGARCAAAGELLPDRRWPLAAPWIRVKTPALMRSLPGGSAVDRLRERGVRALRAAAGVDPGRLRAAGLASALVLGRREGLSAAGVDALRRAGLAHLLAVSGLHVGMVAALAWGLLVVCGVPPAPRRGVVIAVVLAFALLAGGAAPVRRAALAAALYLGARQLGRPLMPLPAVWGVVAALVLMEPAALLSPGFQLSAAVTLAIVRWTGPVTDLFGRFVGRVGAAVLSVPVVAQAGSLPLVGAHFASVPLLGAAVNVAAVPFGFALVTSGLAAVLVAPVWPAAAAAVLGLVGAVSGLLQTVAASGGGATVAFPSLPPALTAVLCCGGVAALMPWRRAWVPAMGVVAASLAWLAVPGAGCSGDGEARMLGVSDGMALLLRGGRPGAAVLVDAGSADDEALGALAAARVRRLDALVLTHPDRDHSGGAAAVLDRLPTGAFVYPAAVAERAEVVRLRRVARARGVREVPVRPGSRLVLGSLPCTVAWPPGSLRGGDNDASLVAVFEVGTARVLVAGDLEAVGERALLATGFPLRAGVLQLPHHGSATSSTPRFLAAVHPVVALAATGLRPRFHYPHPSVVTRVRAARAVLAAQTAGVEVVSWSGRTAVTVHTAVPVAVTRR